MKSTASLPPVQRRALGWVVAAALAAAPGVADGLRVGAGGSLSLGGGRLSLACGDLAIDGTLQVGGGAIAAARDVTSAGSLEGGTGAIGIRGDFASGPTSFTAGTGVVRFEDGCGRTAWVVREPLTFAELEASTSSGKRLRLPATEETVVVARLDLAGQPAARLALSSGTPGAAALLKLEAGGSQELSAIEASDVWATGQYLAPGPPGAYQSVAGPNLQRIFSGEAVVEVPTLDGLGALLLALALAAAAVVALRRTPRNPLSRGTTPS